jgi:hypothetical protein
MSLFVQAVNGEVTQVWDTQPPAGEAGWKSAVEVKPAITAIPLISQLIRCRLSMQLKTLL